MGDILRNILLKNWRYLTEYPTKKNGRHLTEYPAKKWEISQKDPEFPPNNEDQLPNIFGTLTMTLRMIMKKLE